MSSVIRVGLLLILGLVVLARGLVYLNDRLASMGRSQPSAAASAAAPSPAPSTPVPAPSEAALPAVLPPPTERQLLALRAGDPAARWDALVSLRKHAVTPELLGALDDVARQAAEFPEVVRLVTCHRARVEGVSLTVAFDGLPTDPHDVAWSHDGARCLIEIIAARADEDPSRAAGILAERAVRDRTPRVRDALARLDLPELPDALIVAADDRRSSARLRRIAAVETAIAMGAALKWPDRARGWVDDADGHVSSAAVRALAAQTDEASQAIVALEVASRPEHGPLASIVDQAMVEPGTLDLQLAALAADPQQPAFARGNAARIVAGRGGEEACRRLARVGADPAIDADLATAFQAIDQRFGAAFRAEARR
jgi:hypothetical protein